MNKKNRVLSFVMALIMVLGVMAVLPITIGAEGFDYRNIESAQSLKLNTRADIEQDGAIGTDEYDLNFESVSLTTTDGNATKRGTVVQHLSHDATYIYVGLEFPDGLAYGNKYQYLQISVAAFQNFSNAAASYLYGSKGALTFEGRNKSQKLGFPTAKNRPDVGTAIASAFGSNSTLDASLFDSFVNHNSTDNTAVAEIKISKAALAAAGGYSDVSQLETFRYNIAFTDAYSGSAEVGVGASLTADELTAAIATHTDLSNSEAWVRARTSYFAQCIKLEYPEDLFDYRNIASAKALELNTRADIEQDGAIGTGEYDLTFKSVSLTGITERGSVVQHLSHDEDYIYLGVEFIDGVAYSKNGQYIHLDIAAFQNFNNAAASYLYDSKGALTFKGVNGAQTLAFPVVANRPDVGTADTSAFSLDGALDENLFYSFIKKGDNYTAVAEFKISKAALAAAGGMKASQIETFRYSIAFTDYIDTNDDGLNDSSAKARVGASLTADELTAAIATHTDLSGSESWVRSNLAYFAQCINIEYPENYFDYREYGGGEMNSFARAGTIDLGKTDYAPNITDGKVSLGEYADKTQSTALGNLAADSDKDDATGTSGGARDKVTQYLAHDDDWIYMAFELPDYKPSEVAYIYMFPLQEFQNAAASYYQYEYLMFKFNANDTTLVYSSKGAEADVDVHVKDDGITSDTYSGKLTTKDLGDGTYSAVIEAKFSKAALAEAAGEKLKNFKNFRYMLRYDNSKSAKDKYVCWPSHVYADLANTSEKLTTTSESGKTNINHWTSFWGISVNLDYKYAFDYRNYDSANHNLYLDKSNAAASKELDGVIGADEYSMSFDVHPRRAEKASTLYTSFTSNQYLSHDDDYIYIGAVIPSVWSGSGYPIRLNISPLQDTTDSITSFLYGATNSASAKESISFAAIATETKMRLNSAGATRPDLPVHVDSTSIAQFGTAGSVPNADAFDSIVSYTPHSTNSGGNGGTAVIEVKISKAALVAAGKLDSVEDLANFRYNFVYYMRTSDGGRTQAGLAPSFTYDELTELIYNSTSLGSSQDSWTRNEGGQSSFGFCINLKNYVSIESADRGSVRIGDSKNTSGLRFQTTVSKGYIKDLEKQGYTVSIGTIIALDSNMPTFDSDGPVGTFINVVAYLDKPYASDADTITFAGSIVNIKESHFDTAFTAVGYIKLTMGGVTTYVYSNAVTKTVSVIAGQALDDVNASYNAGELAVLNYLAGRN